jgi:hypothetical protein
MMLGMLGLELETVAHLDERLKTLADHLMIGKDTWISLKERGLGF